MRTLSESREEFNSEMKKYIAMIIQTEHMPFSRDFFMEKGLPVPICKVYYTPPSWVGVEYSPSFCSVLVTDKKPKKSREEVIPEIKPSDKYLICDDYSNEGETFEIAMLRLVQNGVNIDNIWAISRDGNSEMTKRIVLDKGREWHKYRLRRNGTTRLMMKELGFQFPSLDLENILALP